MSEQELLKLVADYEASTKSFLDAYAKLDKSDLDP